MAQQVRHTVEETINSVNTNRVINNTSLNNNNNNNNNGNSNLNSSVIIHHISCNPPPPQYTINFPSGHLVVNDILISNQGDPPPTYEEVIDRNAPPPSYDSLFGRVREAHKTSKGVFEFLLNIVVLLLGTFACTAIIGITIFVPVYMIIIGGMYLYDCPQSEYIPVYLLVGGVFGIFKQLLNLSARSCPQPNDEGQVRQSPTLTLINCFTLGWFIIGSMWIYKEYEPNYDPKLGKYCNKTLYLSAFWLITTTYIVTGIGIAFVCCIWVASITFQM